MEAIKSRAAVSADISRFLTSVQPSLYVEITAEGLSSEGILSIATKITNSTAYAVRVGFPLFVLSTDPANAAVTQRTSLTPESQYEFIGDRVVTGYMAPGGVTYHAVTIRLKLQPPPRDINYRITYPVETDQQIRNIVKKYLAGTIKDFSPADVDALPKNTFSWTRRVAVR